MTVSSWVLMQELAIGRWWRVECMKQEWRAFTAIRGKNTYLFLEGTQVLPSFIILLKNFISFFYFLVSSYDEKLRLWDLRSTKKPVSETNLNGGIWRLKWDPFKQNHLLAACMYGGFRLVKYDDSQGISVVGEFHEHESIAYGCDWSYLSPSELSKKNIYQDNNNAHLVGTCSFYDHLLKISVVEKLHWKRLILLKTIFYCIYTLQGQSRWP